MKKGQEGGSTRRLIMTLLKKKGPLTIGALAEELGITEMGVRRHVLQLEQESLAKTKVVRQAMGRPLHVYSLTERAEDHFPKSYHNLALELLRELDYGSGLEAVNVLFEGRRRRMLAQYAPMRRTAIWRSGLPSCLPSRMPEVTWLNGIRKRTALILCANIIVRSAR